mmetsp:Transcript_2729/g.6302  ORF Transcript_2729/g.6302 Transcript_2729/m.6302 type:complete len:389 (+) Transcript_2729:211-1377(+)
MRIPMLLVAVCWQPLLVWNPASAAEMITIRLGGSPPTGLESRLRADNRELPESLGQYSCTSLGGPECAFLSGQKTPGKGSNIVEKVLGSLLESFRKTGSKRKRKKSRESSNTESSSASKIPSAASNEPSQATGRTEERAEVGSSDDRGKGERENDEDEIVEEGGGEEAEEEDYDDDGEDGEEDVLDENDPHFTGKKSRAGEVRMMEFDLGEMLPEELLESLGGDDAVGSLEKVQELLEQSPLGGNIEIQSFRINSNGEAEQMSIEDLQGMLTEFQTSQEDEESTDEPPEDAQEASDLKHPAGMAADKHSEVSQEEEDSGESGGLKGEDIAKFAQKISETLGLNLNELNGGGVQVVGMVGNGVKFDRIKLGGGAGEDDNEDDDEEDEND